MFAKFSEQVKKSAQPAPSLFEMNLFEMNLNALELLYKQQTELVSGMINDSVKLLSSLTKQSEVKAMAPALKVPLKLAPVGKKAPVAKKTVAKLSAKEIIAGKSAGLSNTAGINETAGPNKTSGLNKKAAKPAAKSAVKEVPKLSPADVKAAVKK